MGSALCTGQCAVEGALCLKVFKSYFFECDVSALD